MRFRIPVFLAFVFLSVAWPSRAEEPPYLRFVRGLREKQLPDLAVEYLEGLQAKKLSPELTAVLALEGAKARLDLAALESDAGRRMALQERARKEFEAFLQKHAKHPLAADAYLEIARIVALRGKGQLALARRQETPEAHRAELAKARVQFEQAGKQLEAAAAQIQSQLEQYAEPKTPEDQAAKQALTRARLQAECELGINLIDQAQTYMDQSEFGKRGEIVKRASTVLDKVASQETNNAICTLARVWLGRSYEENDDPKAARKIYESVAKESGDHAEAARRLALYFQMRVTARDPDVKNPVASFRQVEQMGERWLAEYKAYHNTPEGCGVRYELANACMEQALRNPKAPPVQNRAGLQKAQRYFQGLEQSENEFSEAARQSKLRIVLTISEERSRGDITKLKDFEECFLRAQLEVAKLNREEKELKGDQLDKARGEHYRNMVQALTRALDLADPKTSAQEQAEARYLLTRAYLHQGDLYRAIVVGEDLARTAPQTPRAPLAGTFALYAYSQLIRNEEQASAGAEVVDADRERLRKLADYIEKTWPTDAAADVARHQLGRVLFGEKKYPEAVAVLGRITPSYVDGIWSHNLLASAAALAQAADAKPPAGQPSYQQIALDALQSMPELPQGADAGMVQAYVEARLRYGSLLYSQKDYPRLMAVADALQKRLASPDVTLEEAARNEFRPQVKALEMLAKLGEADTAFRAGDYAKAAAVLEPYLTQLKNPMTAGQLLEIKHPGLLHGVLSLAMRAYVQDNKTDRAQDVLQLLQKAAPENSLDILKDLVRQLSQQIHELRQKGMSAQALLDQTVQSFSFFLDELARQKDLKPEMVLFLAESYGSLDKHKTAAELLAPMPEPKPEGDAKTADPKKLALYRLSRLLLARELRLARQFGKAKTELDHILGTPERPGWGAGLFEVKKERIFLLEDQDKYAGKGGAVLEWNALLHSMQKQRGQDARVKDQFYECYYLLTHSIYKYALTEKDKAKSRKDIQRAANSIVSLERLQSDFGGEASKKRFEELLQSEAPLREAYEELKKSSK